jgi:hypothetical protein
VENHQPEPDWKQKLRQGKLKTPFRHYTALAEGMVGILMLGFSCRRGPALMAVNTWAESVIDSEDLLQAMGREIGFTVTGKIRVFETEPSEPPKPDPYGYEVRFTPLEEKADLG